MLSLSRLAAPFIVIATLAGCSPPQTTSTMVPNLTGIDAVRAAPAYRNAIALGQISVDRPLFADALGRTLQLAGLSGEGGRFRLDVLSLGLQRPYAGFGMTVTATIAYRLVEASSGKVVYDRTLTALGTATLEDAVENDNRLRIADDRAIANNFLALVRDLYALP